MQLVLLGISDVFKKGDLFKFNKQGMDLFKYITGSIGVVSSDPKLLYEYGFHTQPEKTEYYAYDILVCGQLFMDIPEILLSRITQDEKDTSRMEKIPEREQS